MARIIRWINRQDDVPLRVWAGAVIAVYLFCRDAELFVISVLLFLATDALILTPLFLFARGVRAFSKRKPKPAKPIVKIVEVVKEVPKEQPKANPIEDAKRRYENAVREIDALPMSDVEKQALVNQAKIELLRKMKGAING